MRQNLPIFLSLAFLIILLIGLNAASYVQTVKKPDNELLANRSTYNTGSTGTRALYNLLAETGRKVTRWQLPPAELRMETRNKPATFIVIGPLKREFTNEEATRLFEWVADGGRLVIIDREPAQSLLATTAAWEIAFLPASEKALFSTDPANQNEMTVDALAARPQQPTILTAGVIAAQPSRFASTIKLSRSGDLEFGRTPKEQKINDNGSNKEQSADLSPQNGAAAAGENKGESAVTDEESLGGPEDAWFKGPASHLASGDRDILVDVPFGAGEIVYLADPFIVSNGGIAMVDNARLAINIAGSPSGLIAFDEYHHGYGSENNRILEYFQGTPVIAIFLQLTALAAFALFSQSRRFARPVPAPEPDRLSKLEYVEAMAELQRRTRAHDLAIENIYSEFRRRTARHFGLDNFTAKSSDIAGQVAEHSGIDLTHIKDAMFKCEEIIRGEPTNKSEVLQLTEALRAMEQKLGIMRSGRTKI